MKALLQKQQQEEAMRNMLKNTEADRSIEQRIAACKEIQYEQHQPLFAVFYTTIHKAAQDNSIAGLKYFLHEQHKKQTKNSRAVGSHSRKGNKFTTANNNAEADYTKAGNKKKVAIDDLDDFGYAAIHYAAERQCIDALQYLCTQQVDYNLHAQFSGNTALMCASKEKKTESIRCLLGVGAELSARNCTGMNCVHFAAQGNHVEVLLTILDVLEFEGMDVLAKRYGFKRRGNDRKVAVEDLSGSKKGSGKASKKISNNHSTKKRDGLKLPPIRGATPLEEEGEGEEEEEDQQEAEEADQDTLPSHRSGFSSQSGTYQLPNTSSVLPTGLYSMHSFLPPLPYQPSRFSSLLDVDDGQEHDEHEHEDDHHEDTIAQPQATGSSGYVAQHDTMSLATSVEARSQVSSASALSVNQQQQLHIARILRKLLNQPSHNQSTPLHVACQYNSAQVVQLLLDLAMMGIVKMEAQDSSGETPLHRAGRQGYRDLFQLVTSYGASTKIENIFHETPKDLLVDAINY